MTEHEHDEKIEDLDVTDAESEDIKGGLLPAVHDIGGVQSWKLNVGDGSVNKVNPGLFQQKG